MTSLPDSLTDPLLANILAAARTVKGPAIEEWSPHQNTEEAPHPYLANTTAPLSLEMPPENHAIPAQHQRQLEASTLEPPLARELQPAKTQPEYQGQHWPSPASDLYPWNHPNRARAHNAYINHLMGPGLRSNCCHAPTSHHCPLGAKLRQAYLETTD
jgi:hypothetical protein